MVYPSQQMTSVAAVFKIYQVLNHQWISKDCSHIIIRLKENQVSSVYHVFTSWWAKQTNGSWKLKYLGFSGFYKSLKP